MVTDDNGNATYYDKRTLGLPKRRPTEKRFNFCPTLIFLFLNLTSRTFGTFCFASTTQAVKKGKTKRAKSCQRTNNNDMKAIFYATILILLTASGCTTTKDFTEIQFGGGGGFTGQITTYQLNADGTIQDITNGKAETLKKIEKRKVKELFVLAEKIKTYQFNEPENLYTFIEIKSKEGKNKIVWNAGSTKIDKNATALYSELMLLIK